MCWSGPKKNLLSVEALQKIHNRGNPCWKWWIDLSSSWTWWMHRVFKPAENTLFTLLLLYFELCINFSPSFFLKYSHVHKIGECTEFLKSLNIPCSHFYYYTLNCYFLSLFSFLQESVHLKDFITNLTLQYFFMEWILQFRMSTMKPKKFWIQIWWYQTFLVI